MPLAVELRRVSFAYGNGPPVLRDVDLTIRPGEFVAVAGPNGGGKTTLVRLVVGLEEPSSGDTRCSRCRACEGMIPGSRPR